VRSGVDFDLRNDAGLTPLACAIRWSRMPAVRFLLEQYRARGTDEQEVLRDLVRRPPLSGRTGTPYPLILLTIESTMNTSDEKRHMVKFLVQ